MKQLFCGVLLALTLAGCWEQDLERTNFNAYFFYPNNGREGFLGLVKGISACQSAAHSRARSLQMTSSTGYSYICCEKTSSSECATKHK